MTPIQLDFYPMTHGHYEYLMFMFQTIPFTNRDDPQNEDSGFVTIRHGLNYGEMSDDFKSAFVVRGLGHPEIEASLWALRGTRSWKTGHKTRFSVM